MIRGICVRVEKLTFVLQCHSALPEDGEQLQCRMGIFEVETIGLLVGLAGALALHQFRYGRLEWRDLEHSHGLLQEGILHRARNRDALERARDL